ncbi:unnamed protein product, partial [Polarella glacialis]
SPDLRGFSEGSICEFPCSSMAVHRLECLGQLLHFRPQSLPLPQSVSSDVKQCLTLFEKSLQTQLEVMPCYAAVSHAVTLAKEELRLDDVFKMLREEMERHPSSSSLKAAIEDAAASQRLAPDMGMDCSDLQLPLRCLDDVLHAAGELLHSTYVEELDAAAQSLRTAKEMAIPTSEWLQVYCEAKDYSALCKEVESSVEVQTSLKSLEEMLQEACGVILARELKLANDDDPHVVLTHMRVALAG